MDRLHGLTKIPAKTAQQHLSFHLCTVPRFLCLVRSVCIDGGLVGNDIRQCARSPGVLFCARDVIFEFPSGKEIVAREEDTCPYDNDHGDDRSFFEQDPDNPRYLDDDRNDVVNDTIRESIVCMSKTIHALHQGSGEGAHEEALRVIDQVRECTLAQIAHHT